jgi:multidrug efflux pump subunit AcrA (membrane-fusion protein)
MYIKANVNQGIQKGVLLVPQIAVLRQNNGTNMVYTIKQDGDKNVVEQHNITISGEHDHDYIVTSGINANDKVITSNLQKIGPGAPVTPIENKPEPANNPDK